jgi:hypothetical protein
LILLHFVKEEKNKIPPDGLHNKTPTKQKQLRGSSTDAKKEKNILREEEEAHGSSIQLNKQQQMRLMNLTKK